MLRHQKTGRSPQHRSKRSKRTRSPRASWPVRVVSSVEAAPDQREVCTPGEGPRKQKRLIVRRNSWNGESEPSAGTQHAEDFAHSLRGIAGDMERKTGERPIKGLVGKTKLMHAHLERLMGGVQSRQPGHHARRVVDSGHPAAVFCGPLCESTGPSPEIENGFARLRLQPVQKLTRKNPKRTEVPRHSGLKPLRTAVGIVSHGM